MRDYNSSNVNIFLKIQWKDKEHHPTNTDVIATSRVNSFILLDYINNVVLTHVKLRFSNQLISLGDDSQFDEPMAERRHMRF
jgi:hypothetical protein